VITYGSDESGAQIAGRDMALEAFGSQCTVVRRNGGVNEQVLGRLRLKVPGRHNLLNALGAVAVGLEVGVAFDRIAGALGEFQGAERRFQLHGEVDGVMVVDDYGHHPTEIAAVIAAARAGIGRRVVIVFQPHRYTRTRDLLDAFGDALGAADEVVLTDIYAAGEAPIAGVTIQGVEAAVRRTGTPVRVVASLDDLPRAVAAAARPNDLVITLGAGSIGSVPDRILDELSRRAPTRDRKGADEWA
jgi:UDP-N-acetylmuramate--alanine ligase